MKHLLLSTIALCLAIVPSRSEELKQEPPKSLRTYVIPEESFHPVNDYEEAARRWKAIGEGFTLDIFSISTGKPLTALTPIVKATAMKKMGTKEAEKAILVEISVTDEQDRLIREALAKKGGISVNYYHFGW